MRSNREPDGMPMATGPGTLTWVPFFLALAVSTPALSQAAEEPARVLRAGAAAVDITPSQHPINTPGRFAHRLSERAHDPLHARALALDSGTTAVALVIVDNLEVPVDVIDAAKSNASRKTRPTSSSTTWSACWPSCTRTPAVDRVVLKDAGGVT